MLDYVAFKTNSTSSAEFRIALKEEQTNSLKQITNFAVDALPVIIEAANAEQEYEEYDDEYFYDEEADAMIEPAW